MLAHAIPHMGYLSNDVAREHTDRLLTDAELTATRAAWAEKRAALAEDRARRERNEARAKIARLERELVEAKKLVGDT